MLVLSRKTDSNILIGDNVTLTVVAISGDKVRLGIDAPQDVCVQRREVLNATHRERKDHSSGMTYGTGAGQSEINLSADDGIVLTSTKTRSRSEAVKCQRKRGDTTRRSTKKYFIGGFELAEVENDDESPIVLLLRRIDERMLDYFTEYPRHLLSLPSRGFEEFVAELFSGFGYEVELTPRTRDGGRDVIAVSHEIVDQRILVECKRYAQHNPVGVSVIRELYGVTQDENATCGVVATTSFFTKGASSFLAKHEWELHGRDFKGIEQWLQLYRERKKGLPKLPVAQCQSLLMKCSST